MSAESKTRLSPRFNRKLDGKRHVLREFLCWFGFHSESAFVPGPGQRWCWYCGEDYVRNPLEDRIARFNAWAKELDRQNKSGRFGKYPWQKHYGPVALAAEAQVSETSKQSSVRVVPTHYATKQAWEWLLRGDGMRLPPEKHERIKGLLLDADEVLNAIDRETSNQDSESA